MIDQLASRAKAALSHRHMSIILGFIPQAERSNPRLVASWLKAAALTDPGLADVPAFRDAVGAVEAWRQGADLANQAGALWHDDRIRSNFTESELQWVLANPRAAYKALISDPHRISDGDLRHEVLLVLAGAEALATEHGLPFGDRAAAPAIPQDAAGQNEEYATLIAIPPGKLTQAQHNRLLQLADGRVQREEADLQRAVERQHQPHPDRPDEYRSLIAKSLRGPLSAADQARLGALATRRAYDEGLTDSPHAPPDPDAGREAPPPAAQPDTSTSTEGAENG